jgi:ABC-type branched-subunit amino acid transport system ATPase component
VGETALLELKGLQVAYGGIQAVKGIDLVVRERELVCLIGANGAGKTTTLKGITGLQPIKSGSIHYDGRWFPRDAASSERSPSRKIWPWAPTRATITRRSGPTSSACTGCFPG